MTEDRFRTAPARDVPTPRPVTPAAPAPEETGLGRAARAVAEAVAGLVGAPGGSTDGPRRSAAGGLKDVVGAVAGALSAAFAPARDGGPVPPPAGPGAGGSEGSEGSPGAILGELLSAAAPRLPIRDAERLRQAHPGASDDEIADALVARAARLTSTIGAAAGGLLAAHWFASPSLIALPLELGAETVLVAAVEVVLIGELHELHGRAPDGDARARVAAYLAGWSAQRSVEGAEVIGMGSLLSGAGLRALQRRVTRRMAGATPSTAPLLIGAAVAGRSNRRATEKLAEQVLAGLRRTGPPGQGS